MEGAPQTTEANEVVESLAGWESLRNSATNDAAELMSESGMDDLEGAELIDGLKGLLETLADDNSNRFAAEAIAQTITAEEAILTYQEATKNLPLAA
jgi:hypothetical protein